VGLATAGGLAEISGGVMGTAATWVASTGSRAAGWARGADSALGRSRNCGFLSGPKALTLAAYLGSNCPCYYVVLISALSLS
jgi:hypothetical protein